MKKLYKEALDTAYIYLDELIRGPSRHIYENKFYEDDDELLIHNIFTAMEKIKLDKNYSYSKEEWIIKFELENGELGNIEVDLGDHDTFSLFEDLIDEEFLKTRI